MRLPRYRTGDPELDTIVVELLERSGSDPANQDLVFELIASALRLARDGADRGDLKIANAALKEMRYTFHVFAPYRHALKVAMFGSARTEPDDPLYEQARAFAAAMAERDWMVITGAGPGIMEAGLEGAGPDHSFGVSIRLPFEASSSQFIAGDPKLVNFRYFFTRKLAFVKEADGFVLLPGGYGTLDEAFELLTLVQTGKAQPGPIVLLDVPGGTYWSSWARVRPRRAHGPRLRRRARPVPRRDHRRRRRRGRRGDRVLRELPLAAIRRRAPRAPDAAAHPTPRRSHASTTSSPTSSPAARSSGSSPPGRRFATAITSTSTAWPSGSTGTDGRACASSSTV